MSLMTADTPPSPEEIADFIVEFCRSSRISPDHDISSLKRKLWRQIAKSWPGAQLIVVNRALSLAYETLIADTANKHGISIIEAIRRDL
jgi:hypothetical protein